MEPAKVTVEDLSESRKRLQVEIAAPDVQAELDRTFTTLGRQARLPGFRPGRAPRSVLERMFGDQVRREVLTRLVEESFHHAVHSHNLPVVGLPEIDADDVTPGEALRYSATIDVRPVIDVGDLARLEATRAPVEVGDDDVERVLASLRESVATLTPIEDRHVVETGDVVSVNLTSHLEGAEPVSREDVLLEAGSGTFAGALERQLVGLSRGAQTSITVAYPADHASQTLAGKAVVFDVEVRDLRTKVLPPLDDDFARDHGRCDSLAELRSRIRADLERQASERAEGAVREALVGQLIAAHPFEVPSTLVQRRVESMLSQLDVRLPPGAERDQALAGVAEQLKPRAEHEVRAELLLDAVAEREGIAVEDADVDAEIARLAARDGQAPERARALYERPELRAALRANLVRRRAMERVLSQARIVPSTTAGDIAPEDRSR
jgi:trigger factor